MLAAMINDLGTTFPGCPHFLRASQFNQACPNYCDHKFTEAREEDAASGQRKGPYASNWPHGSAFGSYGITWNCTLLVSVPLGVVTVT